MSDTFIFLASASPRRHELLNQIGIAHQVIDVPSPPGEDEPQHIDESPADYVLRTALEKAERAVAWVSQQGLPAHPILSADTTVILDGAVLGKPKDAADAKRMLGLLSGHTHEVRTAVVLAHEGHIDRRVSVTQVRFAALSTEEIDAYCDSGEPFGKAGAYGIQGRAGAFVESIEGSYSGVMGLPVYDVAQLLKARGLQVG